MRRVGLLQTNGRQRRQLDGGAGIDRQRLDVDLGICINLKRFDLQIQRLDFDIERFYLQIQAGR